MRFVLDFDDINELQVNSIRKTIEKAKHAHYVDLVMRANGMDNIGFEADWVKYLKEEDA